MALERIKITVKRIKKDEVISRILQGTVSVSAKAPEDGLLVKSSSVGSSSIYVPDSVMGKLGNLGDGESLVFDPWEKR